MALNTGALGTTAVGGKKKPAATTPTGTQLNVRGAAGFALKTLQVKKADGTWVSPPTQRRTATGWVTI